jgi:hypothetical protein
LQGSILASAPLAGAICRDSDERRTTLFSFIFPTIAQGFTRPVPALARARFVVP